MCKTSNATSSLKSKAEKKKQKELEIIKRKERKIQRNIPPCGSKALEWKRNAVYSTVKFLIIGLHLIASTFIVKTRYLPESTSL